MKARADMESANRAAPIVASGKRAAAGRVIGVKRGGDGRRNISELKRVRSLTLRRIKWKITGRAMATATFLSEFSTSFC